MLIFYPWLKVDALNGFIAAAISLFCVLIIIYSSRFMNGKPKAFQYYTYIILTAIAAIAAVLSNNLLFLLICWGFLGLTLYLLINMGDKGSEAAAKKTFIIIGGSDALMLLGIGLVYYLTGTFQMDQINIPLTPQYSSLATFAYLCIAIACLAKAGAVPLHSWLPDCSEYAPLPVAAYLPASLDKMLGIYLLARCSLNLFVMSEAMNIFLMILGAFTILAGVMMALFQHNMKRLLGYHAVSQVGYMVLGIGTGLPVGIAGGIFHMLNNAVYKAALFLTAGNVEYKTKTVELDKLGGLAKLMPYTYIAALICSLSISGVPPFNGFVSKWMIYQGLVNQLRVTNYGLRITAILCLVAAMFGSGLTLASFMKLLHSTYLGQSVRRLSGKESNEVPRAMWLPCVILAGICVIFGIFAYQLPLKYFIFPAVGGMGVDGLNIWYSGFAMTAVIIGLALGIFIFKFNLSRPSIRQDSPFIGAEPLELGETRVTGTEFYNTIKEYGIIRGIYENAEKGLLDIYEQGKTVVFGIGRFLQYLHNGILPTYLVWTLLGMIWLFFKLGR